MGEEHRINEIKGVIISRALLKEYGYDGDMPTDKQMQVIGNGLLEYWGVSDGFKEALASTMENMFGVNLFIIGLGKKVLIANQMGNLSTAMFATTDENGVVGT